MWIARDKDGSLWLYYARPVRKREKFMLTGSLKFLDIHFFEINKDEFPEVTWENSPKEITTTTKTKK